jgi:hypothetical protein
MTTSLLLKIHGWLESDDDGDEGRDWRSGFIFARGTTGVNSEP